MAYSSPRVCDVRANSPVVTRQTNDRFSSKSKIAIHVIADAHFRYISLLFDRNSGYAFGGLVAKC